MTIVLNRTTKELRTSIHTPDFPTVDWIHEPVLSAVTGFASKYWIITGDAVTLMNQAARDAVDVQEAADALAGNRAEAKTNYDKRDLKALALIILDEINILRSQHGLAARTSAQLKTAHSNKVDAI